MLPSRILVLITNYLLLKLGFKNYLSLMNYSKDFNFDNILKEINDEIVSSNSYISLVNPEFKEHQILAKYYIKLAETVTPEELSLANHNLQDLVIKHKHFHLLLSGKYEPKKNTITYYEKSSLPHEFLHFASTRINKDKDCYICGFGYIQNNQAIARGLNEGYTELLASRIFNHNHINSYHPLVNILKMIELFFSNPDDLRKLYFNGDLPAFIKYMKQFMSHQEITNLILKMDDLIYYIGGSKEIEIENFLYNTFIKNFKDEAKLQAMEELVSSLTLHTYLIRRKKNNKFSTYIPKNILISRAYKKLLVSIVTSTLSTSLILGSYSINNMNQNRNNTEALVTSGTVESGYIKYFELSDDYYIQIDNKMVTSFSGKYLYDEIISQGFSYCKILGEYYTLEGGPITITEYQANYRQICNNDNTQDKDMEDVTYTYEENELVAYWSKKIIKFELPNGNSYYEDDSPSNITALQELSSTTYYSYPYQNLCNYTITCSGFKNTTTNTYEEITYGLKKVK